MSTNIGNHWQEIDPHSLFLYFIARIFIQASQCQLFLSMMSIENQRTHHVHFVF